MPMADVRLPQALLVPQQGGMVSGGQLLVLGLSGFTREDEES